MTEDTKFMKIVLRNDTAANWGAVGDTAILLLGEMGVEVPDDGSAPKLKLGDGKTVWNQLPYLKTENDDLAAQLETLAGTVGGYDIRIANTESGVAAAVTASESALTEIEAFKAEVNESLSGQNAQVEEMKTKVDENTETVAAMQTTVDSVTDRQDTQQLEIDAANSRVDVLVAGFSEDAEFDNAELLDIRAGYDGEIYESAGKAVRQIGYDLEALSQNLVGALGKDIPDGLVYEGTKLYLTSGGEQIGDAVTVVGGSGGGGSADQTYTITLMNLLDQRNFTLTGDDACVLEFSYTSVDEDGFDDGAGIGYVYVGSSLVKTTAIEQGTNTIDVTPYLVSGENTIKVQVENSEGNRKTLTYKAQKLVLAVTTTYPKMSLCSGMVSFTYIVTGAGTKTVHFLMDGREIATDSVVTSGGSRTVVIPEQTDGAHILTVYAEVPISLTENVRSNELEIGMLFHSKTSTTQAILMMQYEGPKEVEQGATLTFPYMVYNPFLQTTDITLSVYAENGTLYDSTVLQVDQSPKEWITQDYPAGKVTFEIVCHDARVTQVVDVKATTFTKTIITDGCVLDFNARGRSNNENNPAHWEYGDVNATFSGFGWANVDGWYDTESGQTALRFLPGDTMAIHYQPFEEDFRVSGWTMEAEFETHNVRDYDSIIIDSFNGGRGMRIKSQAAELASELSGVSLQFKEDSRVRVCFVVEQLSLHRFVYIYVNGVMCSVVQYPDNDDFSQAEPVEIDVGSESCGLDLFSLRMYNKGFTRHEQLNNFICDRPTLAERIEANSRNSVLDENDQVTIEHLPMSLPYMILECEELPQFKGDKKKNKSVTYVDPLHPNRNFTATGVQLDVQGTSSAGYPRKNYKVSLKEGLTYTNTGETAAGFPVFEGGLEGKNICLKVDFASSEHANNVCLVDYYEMLSPYKNPAQQADARVRTAVRGFPCAVFWRNTTTNETTFIATYNFNDDKSNENVFGFDRDVYPNCECVEFCNNTSDRVLFNKSEYEEWSVDEDNNPIEAWRLDFEYRFPDLDDPYKDYTQFKRMTDWVVSTNRTLATGEALESTKVLPHWSTGAATMFSEDTADYRLSKFKAEFKDYFIKDAMIFYYLFTEVFVLADNRAKNLFLTTFDGQHWFPIPYDMDTAIGINNEGNLVFEYDVEDTDTPNGANVFTGQNSALWHNVRDCFANERRTMYQELRSGNLFSYDVINTKMRDHQDAWPEALWNEDAYIKYIGSLLDQGENYLEMLQGDKKAQRDWWLYNGFKYRDSKYNAGDALTNYITLRCYEVGNITVTPYSHICPRIKYGSVYAGGERVKRNTPVELVCTQDEMDDTEVYIYSADRLASVGDLSHLKVGLAVFSAATKLQDIVLGSDAEGYENPNLYSLEVGNNELLTLVNVTNCTSEKFTGIDLSGCHGLETLLAEGTKLTGVNLPNGGHLHTLKLPSVANLTIQNQKNIETLSLESQENLSTLRIEGTPGLPIETLINGSPLLNRVRLTNIEWTATDEAALRVTMDKLLSAKGLDANGLNTDKAVVTGKVYIESISDNFLEEINDNFPELVVVVNGVAKYFVRYADWNNTLLYRYIATEGTKAIDPIEDGHIETPVRADTETAQYVYKGWSETPETINRPYSIIAQYEATYLVTFYDNKGNIGNQQWVKEHESAVEPVSNGLMYTPTKDSTEQYDYTFSGWDLDYTSIDGSNLVFYPAFSESLRSYWVYFYNDDRKIQESQVFYGDVPIFTGNTDEIYKYIGDEVSDYYEFVGWSPDPSQPITGLTYFYAQFAFNGYIEDSWEDIIAACKSGDTSKYGLGGRKTLTYTLAGVESTVEMEIVGKNHDELATADAEYNGGMETAALSFLPKVIGAEFKQMNNSPKEWNGVSNYNAGGWELSTLRALLQGELFNAMPAELQNAIKPVKKISDRGYADPVLAETVDLLWLPSEDELNGDGGLYDQTVPGQGKAYPVFTTYASRTKTRGTSSSNVAYWTRSTGISFMHYFRYVDARGYIANGGASSSMGVAFGFCL